VTVVGSTDAAVRAHRLIGPRVYERHDTQPVVELREQ
jgi:hypothetical protein